jgi:hypothetical protein
MLICLRAMCELLRFIQRRVRTDKKITISVLSWECDESVAIALHIKITWWNKHTTTAHPRPEFKTADLPNKKSGHYYHAHGSCCMPELVGTIPKLRHKSSLITRQRLENLSTV